MTRFYSQVLLQFSHFFRRKSLKEDAMLHPLSDFYNLYNYLILYAIVILNYSLFHSTFSTIQLFLILPLKNSFNISGATSFSPQRSAPI